jgi:pimeloyl-ACP methyl ester carboxylesterase
VRRTFTTASGLVGSVTGWGPALLLLHGGPGMTDYMQSIVPELNGYQAALLQQRGVAPSTLAGPFDVPTLRDDVIEVLDTLGWESRRLSATRGAASCCFTCWR